uniref:Uncharacterized protein n=1 Tax=Gossypium raimondii TaxID=29730 RepID=A0A0D2SD01_GOSRA|nr:hypothetical protein B456_009G336400 [Gossypium raimondii]
MTCFGSSIFVSSILHLVYLLKKKRFVSVSCQHSYEEREDEERKEHSHSVFWSSFNQIKCLEEDCEL